MNVFRVRVCTQPMFDREESTRTSRSVSWTTSTSGRPNSATASTRPKNSSQTTGSGRPEPKT